MMYYLSNKYVSLYDQNTSTHPMEARYYSDKSIAIYGDTKPWAENLKELGGRFNPKLRDGPGWIFQRAREHEIMDFLSKVQSGLIQPMQQMYQTSQMYQTPQMVPFGQIQPGMTPQAAMSRLTIQPQYTTQIPAHQTSTLIRPQTIAPVYTNAPQIIKPVNMLETKPTTVNFPNMFTAADGLTYQIILCTIPSPYLGQKVDIIMDNTVFHCQVTEIPKAAYPVDNIYLTEIFPDEDIPERDQLTFHLVVVNCKWQVFGMQDDHVVTFLPLGQTDEKTATQDEILPTNTAQVASLGANVVPITAQFATPTIPNIPSISPLVSPTSPTSPTSPVSPRIPSIPTTLQF